jgi:hypothetical protein
MESGAEAASRGDIAGADDRFRRAWRDAGVREEAAAALHELHKTPGFKLGVDEAIVGRNARLVGSSFRRTETPHFVILSDCAPDWTQARGRVLERTRDQFFRVAARLGAPVYPHRTKLLCILFDSRDDYTAFARAHDGMEAGWVAGYYATLSNRIVFYNDSSSPGFAAADERLEEAQAQVRQLRDRAMDAERESRPDAARQLRTRADDLERQVKKERTRLEKAAGASSTAKATHEAVHLLAFNTGLQQPDRDYPFWVSEGLATTFETESVENAFGPDRPPTQPSRKDRFDDLRTRRKLIPLAELIRMTEAPSGDAERADAMYAQSQTLFATLFAHDPKALGGYLADLAEGPEADPARRAALFEARFGSPEQVEKRLLRRAR